MLYRGSQKDRKAFPGSCGWCFPHNSQVSNFLIHFGGCYIDLSLVALLQECKEHHATSILWGHVFQFHCSAPLLLLPPSGNARSSARRSDPWLANGERMASNIQNSIEPDRLHWSLSSCRIQCFPSLCLFCFGWQCSWDQEIHGHIKDSRKTHRRNH